MSSESITKPQPKTSRYQVVSSMTVDELLSEGYANYDDLYNPSEEEWKIEIAKIEQMIRDNPVDFSDSIPF